MEHSEDDSSKTKYFSTTEYSGGEMFGYNTPEIKTEIVPFKRPGIISFFCILGFISVGAGFILSFTETARSIGSWYPAFLWLSVVVHAVSYIGLWRMKITALWLLTIMTVVSHIVLASMDLWTPLSLGSVLILVIMWFHAKKMT